MAGNGEFYHPVWIVFSHYQSFTDLSSDEDVDRKVELYILAILCPPLAVAVICDRWNDKIIYTNAVLTLLGFIPGVLHALFKVRRYNLARARIRELQRVLAVELEETGEHSVQNHHGTTITQTSHSAHESTTSQQLAPSPLSKDVTRPSQGSPTAPGPGPSSASIPLQPPALWTKQPERQAGVTKSYTENTAVEAQAQQADSSQAPLGDVSFPTEEDSQPENTPRITPGTPASLAPNQAIQTRSHSTPNLTATTTSSSHQSSDVDDEASVVQNPAQSARFSAAVPIPLQRKTKSDTNLLPNFSLHGGGLADPPWYLNED
ncbi:hypothetical protein IAR55_003847 [Kwoniella newhampshirensis]|uniref:Uncharacterized protein n=1 Tax=Kwoniella newhampshirensis TaxID=1651941 RepID=A0AAW0YQF2_9TREE